MSEKDKEMNKGNEALINRYATIMPGLEKSAVNRLGLEIYIDGYASGNDGNCPGSGVTVSVQGVVLGHKTLLEWDSLEPGSYSVTVSAPPQANLLNVHIVVDNP